MDDINGAKGTTKKVTKTTPSSSSSSSSQAMKNQKKYYPKYEPPPNPAKIKVRKEDAICHMSAFAILMILYLISVYYTTNKDTVSQPSILSEIQKDLEKNNNDVKLFIEPMLPSNQVIQKITESGDGNDNGNGVVCSLYIADSSLPNSGFGIFTMKSMKAGDILVPECNALKVDLVDFSPYVMLMKQHSFYGNVKGGIGGSAIVASRNIEEGEEIFIHLEDYPSQFQEVYQKLHPIDPTSVIFDKVDNIVNKFVNAVPMKKVQINKPRGRQYKTKTKPKYAKKPLFDATEMMNIITEMVNNYDPELSNLLPETHVEADSMIEVGGRAKYITNKRSSLWLSENGVCVDGILPSNSLIDDGSQGAFTTRPVVKGDIVITSPLYATVSHQDDENCFAVNANGLVLCPLSFSSYINKGPTSSQCEEGNSEDCPRNAANAFYQWSKFNELNKGLERLSVSDLLQNPLTGLTIDVIASRDLEEGEEIFIDYSSGVENHGSHLQLRDDMIPRVWKE